MEVSIIPQDLALIMGLVDSQKQVPSLQEEREAMKEHKAKGFPVSISARSVNSDSDNSSSDSESEDEVEAQIAAMPGSDGHGNVQRADNHATETEVSEASDAESSNSDSSTSVSSGPKTSTRQRYVDDDGPPVDTYVPSVHEVLPTSVPIRSLPDPSILPQDPLEQVGEISAIFSDSIIIRGSSVGTVRKEGVRERNDAVLDEGSLLLFDDRSPLGYIWETFGPTSLPHYLIRFSRTPLGGDGSSMSPVVPDEDSNNPMCASGPEASPLTFDQVDPAKLLISQPVYHIPSLSNFAFPSALERTKGSDASNIHDEEPAEYELEFSDDEAEALHKRHRKRSTFKATQPACPVLNDNNNDNSFSDAASLYGASPYEFEATQIQNEQGSSSQSGVMHTSDHFSSPLKFDDPAIQGVLMLARKSRNRRRRSMSISETSAVTRPLSREFITPSDSRGKGRGRCRGKERGGRSVRGEGQNIGGHTGDGGYGHGQGAFQGNEGHMPGIARTFFSFEEYDPRMPRPPSPTSIAVAHATGQWADGTPFSYGLAPAGFNSLPQATGFPIPASYGQEFRRPQGHNPSTAYSSPLPQQQQAPYNVAPHINPRFVQAFGYFGLREHTTMAQPSNLTSPLDPTASNVQSVYPAAEQDPQPDQ